MNAVTTTTGEQYGVGKIVCVGRNYAAHAAELGNEVPEFPLIFIKPASALVFDGMSITKPAYSDDMHHEVELVLLIGKNLKNVTPEEAQKGIAGYGVGLDMTLRDVQNELKKKGHPWTIAKCFDTSAAVSDFILSKHCTITSDARISLTVNGVVRQDAPLSLMLFDPAKVVSYISQKMTLEPGDLIFTGTPEGVANVVPGDVLSAKVAGIPELRVTVEAE